jgi:DNA-binding NarL/FixJ family response regulator
MTLRVLLVDDSLAFLTAAQALLSQQGLLVVGTARTSEQAMTLVERVRPDVAVVDLHLGEESGLDLADQLAAVGGSPVVILTSSRAALDVEELLGGHPVRGFVAKHQIGAALIEQMVG